MASMIDLKMCQSAGAAPTSFVSKLYELVSNGPDEVVGFVDGACAFSEHGGWIWSLTLPSGRADGTAFEVRDPRRLEVR